MRMATFRSKRAERRIGHRRLPQYQMFFLLIRIDFGVSW
jgi:hypothetical protein